MARYSDGTPVSNAQRREHDADVLAVIHRTTNAVAEAAVQTRAAAKARGLLPDEPLTFGPEDERSTEADFAARLAAVQANDIAASLHAVPSEATVRDRTPTLDPEPSNRRSADSQPYRDLREEKPRTATCFLHPGRINAARVAADLTQRELAIAGAALAQWYGRTIRPEHISRLESGTIADPTISTGFLLALLLQTSFDYLVGLTDVASPPHRPPLLKAMATLVIREAKAQCRAPSPVPRPRRSRSSRLAKDALKQRQRSAPTPTEAELQRGPKRGRRGPYHARTLVNVTDQPFRELAGLPLATDSLLPVDRQDAALTAAEEAALERTVVHDTLPDTHWDTAP